MAKPLGFAWEPGDEHSLPKLVEPQAPLLSARDRHPLPGFLG